MQEIQLHQIVYVKYNRSLKVIFLICYPSTEGVSKGSKVFRYGRKYSMS